MKFAFVHQHIDHAIGWTVETLCRVIEVTRSGFYAWRCARQRSATPRQVAQAERRKRVAQVFESHKHRYGAPRIHAQLCQEGLACDLKTVAADMKAMGLFALQNKAFRVTTTDSNHGYPIAPNRLERDFTAAAPNRVWVTDLTYVPTAEGWLYLVTILDLFSRKVVGYASADHMRAELCIEALDQAVRKRGRHDGLILHSDRGVQFAADAFRAACTGHGIIQSMSGKGDCYDNAWPRASSARSKANTWTALSSVGVKKRNWKSSTSSKATTTRVGYTRRWATKPPRPSNNTTPKHPP